MGYGKIPSRGYGTHAGALERLFRHASPGEDIDEVSLGISGYGYDLTIYGTTAAAVIMVDESADEMYFNGMDLWLKDDDQLEFGDSSDVVIDWNSTGWTWAAAANNSKIVAGSAAKSFDVDLYGSVSTVNWDASADELKITSGGYLWLGDEDAKTFLKFGDSKDVTLSWTSTGAFAMEALANNSAWNIGSAALSFDTVLYGSASRMSWDASANTLTMSTAELRVDGDVTLPTAGDGIVIRYNSTVVKKAKLSSTGTAWVFISTT